MENVADVTVVILVAENYEVKFEIFKGLCDKNTFPQNYPPCSNLDSSYFMPTNKIYFKADILQKRNLHVYYQNFVLIVGACWLL